MGGAGAKGGDKEVRRFPWGALGAPGGAGGDGSTSPMPGAGRGTHSAGGGGGGAVGHIAVNVRASESVPDIASDPPATVGVIGTH
ncbi:hypothetical protein LVJ94_18375 [Pendulispora rubella]|uniref:Uncharacterized protein n=1 Tax=Pendulispora rubella TaxID=2741070 RepID=A0ABZ2LE31_9BACT